MSEHAISNARAGMADIREAMEALKALESGEAESVIYDGETYDDEDTLRERIDERPLSVQVRGDWHTPGDEEGRRPVEYEILLSTGGPALHIVGELYSGQPETARLEWQDWFTPWTEADTSGEDDEALLAFARLFYFGE